MILDNVNHHLPVHFVRLAEEKKEEGNQLYKLKSYRDALAKYSEAIGELTKFLFGIEEILDMFLSQVFYFTPKYNSRLHLVLVPFSLLSFSTMPPLIAR